MNIVRNLAAFAFLVILLFTFSSVEADKEPVWSWSSSSPITEVSISSDSRNISATYGSSVSLWKNDTDPPHNPINTKTLSQGIAYMEMSSNGKYVLAGEETNKVTLYEEGSKKWDKGGFLNGLYGLDISESGSNISVVDQRNVYFFNKESSTEVWNVNLAPQEMSTVSISPDGRYIAAGTFDGNVYVFLTSDKDDVWIHSGSSDQRITEIDFSGDSSHLIIGTKSGRVHVYPSTGSDNPMTMLQPNEVTCVAADYNSKYYVYGTEEGMLTLFDGTIGSDIWQKDIGGIVKDCKFNGKGTYVFAGSSSKKIVLANATTGDAVWSVNALDAVTAVSLSYKGENLLVGTESGISIYYEQLLDNQAPIAIIEIIDPSIALPGEEITFTGSGTDIDGFVSNYHWSSSIDGNLSLSDNFTKSNLTMGLHTISFMVQDNEGRWSAPVTMEIGVGDFPEVSILSVSNCSDLANCMISLGDTISISASASSTTSDDITIELFEWFSSLDGFISNNLNLTSSELSLGTHTLTFRAKNSVGFWSANVSVNVVVNAVPTIELDSISPNPVIAGEEAQITVTGSDADNDVLSYFWYTESVTLFNEDNKALFSSASTDQGEHIVSVYAQDSKGARSNTLNLTVSIISQPSVELICDPEIGINEEAFFTASAFKPQGSIVKYEWDFDSPSRVLPDSVDFVGFNFATHSYNSTSEDEDGYLVVIKVTDNDDLTATASCRIPVIEESSTESASSSVDDGSIASKLTTTGGLLGIAILLIGIGGLVFYFNRDSFDNYSPPDISKPSKATPESSLFESNSSEEEVRKPTKRKVMRKRVVSKEVPEMMTVECPQCSSQIDIPKVSGTQQLKCPDCGLEGEI